MAKPQPLTLAFFKISQAETIAGNLIKEGGNYSHWVISRKTGEQYERNKNITQK